MQDEDYNDDVKEILPKPTPVPPKPPKPPLPPGRAVW